MLKHVHVAATLLALPTLLMACSGGGKPTTLNGTVTYRQRVALSPDAVVTVRLEDVSRQDAAAAIVAEFSEPVRGRQVPIPFTLRVDPGRIEEGHVYALRAGIAEDGQLRFSTTTATPVLTNGVTDKVELVVEPSGAAPPAGGGEAPVAGATPGAPGTPGSAASLENTYWKAVTLLDNAVVVPDSSREAHFVLHAEGSRLGGTGGCNRLFGSYTVRGDSITFTEVGSTLMACPEPGMTQEKWLIDTLGRARTYRLAGEELDLLAAGRVIGRFRSVYLR